jgi:RNA polymerase sigma-B factor
VRAGVEAVRQDTRDRSIEELHVEYARTGNPELRKRLVLHHLPLARALAKRFGPRTIQTGEDVAQAACIGLIKAIDGFDPARGFRFSTYATRTILGELKRNLRDHTWAIRPSRGAHDLYLATESALEDLTHELGRSPTIPEVATRVGVSVEDILQAREVGLARVTASLDRSMRAHEHPPAEGIGGDDDNLRRVEQRATVDALLADVPEPERTVLRLRFGAGLTQAAIAREIGSSQMHVSRVLRRTLGQLRQALDDGPDRRERACAVGDR